jgi:excisionase family DNA binding protein
VNAQGNRNGISTQGEKTMRAMNDTHKKQPARVTVAADAKLLVSRDEAAQLLSISQRGLDYLIANRRLPTRRIGGRVLIPVADLRKYARDDHPERIVV